MGNELRRNHNPQCWWKKVSVIDFLNLPSISAKIVIVRGIRDCVSLSLHVFLPKLYY